MDELTDPSMRGNRQSVTSNRSTEVGYILSSKLNYPVHRLEALRQNKMWEDPLRPTILAPDPICFFDADAVPLLELSTSPALLNMTNAGLSLSVPMLGHPDGKLFFAVIHLGTENMTAIPLIRHHGHRNRFTRTCFPPTPITILRHSPAVELEHEMIEVCRDTQHVPFYYDAFGGTSHRFGFWLPIPDYQQKPGFRFNLLSGSVASNIVFNNYGVFVNPEVGLGDQIIGGLLVFRVASDDSWRCWEDTVVLMFLGLELKETPEGTLKTASYHCKIGTYRRQPREAPALLAESLIKLRHHLAASKESNSVSRDSLTRSFDDMDSWIEAHNSGKETTTEGRIQVTVNASVKLLNDMPLSHSPGAEVTIAELRFWHNESRYVVGPKKKS